ncbi:hypothetical protein AMEX_G27748 [Astyanax mexicanus]|uniref:Uncharacterized protein n=1 Tax=Astyanax mexicanus TaxID=7994 RepID=A0A8T2KQE4_ASTMX|nr:hypothetical protein AMEX_G27748 [Astyanax mexicanus]
MASARRRQLCASEKRGVRQDLDSWRSKLVQCVGIEKIRELLRNTRVFEDLRLFKDYKPASVSNWSFDEKCLFCCLRREKVKEHVVALTKKIVESGGKPLLGKDNSNIKWREGQVEEFLNAVLHRKEYTPRIPDPHIPVVACDTMQQMISQLAAHYTSNADSQGSPQHNGIVDPSLLKARSITSPTIAATTATAAASAQNPVLSKLLMADQEAPLDLSVKRVKTEVVKTEVVEQDGVLDLSIRKHHNTDCTSPRSPQTSLPKSFVPRDSLDLGLTKAKDLQSTSTLEQFMAKLCLHHQRQVVDAFGFLQTEVKASDSAFQTCSPIKQKPTASVSSHATVQEQLLNQMTEETRKLAVAISTPEVKESAIASVKIKELAPFEQPLKTEGAASVKTLPCVELSTMDIREDSLSSSDLVGAESRSTIDPPKCPTLLIVKNRNSGSLEAKNVTEEISDIQHLKMATNEQSLCTSDTQLQASSSESDIVELSSSSLARVHSEPKYCAVQRSLSAHSRGSSARSCTVLRTPNVITPISQCGTARKSRKATHTLQKDSSGCRVISVPDFTYDVDIVYIDKPITECELQLQNRMLPRKNARKSTRGCKYIGGCWELKTVRTLRKCAENGSGNCPVTMPEITTLITPKHALAKPDGVPPLDVLFAGDCMETVINKKASDQPVETEVPGDVLESEDLIVETSQTGLIQSKEQSSPEQPSDTSVQQDKYAEIPTSVADNDVQTEPENPKDSPSNVVDINVPCTEVEVELVTENLDAPIPDGTLAGPETEDITENTTTEAMLSPSSDLDMPQDVAHDSDNLNSEDLKDENKSSPRDEQQIEAIEQIQVQELNPEMQVATFTGAEKNADLQMTETNLNSEDGTKATEDNTAELGAKSDLIVEEIATNEQPETSKEEKIVQKTPERSSPKKGAVKSIVSSDRCLRSRVSKGTSEQTPQPEMPVPTEVPTELLAQSDVHEKSINTQESKPPLNACKLNEVEETMPSQDDQNNLNASESPKTEKSQKSPVVSEKPDMGTTAENMVCTRRKQKVKDMMVKESESDKEKDVLEVSNAKDEVVAKPQVTLSGGSSNEVAENVEVTPRKTEESPGKSLRSSERMPLRSSSRQIEQPASKGSSSPVKNTVQTPERMSLRNSSTVDQPVAGDSGSVPAGDGRSDHQGRVPLRSRDSYANAEPSVGKESSLSPNRSSSENVIDQKVSDESSDPSELNKDKSSSSTAKSSSDTRLASSASSSETISGHMPLRSGKTSNSPSDQPSSDTSHTNSASSSENTGHMPLRSGKTSNPPTEQPSIDINLTSSTSSSESSRHMPLRSGKTSNSQTEQPNSDTTLTSSIGSNKSTGHMPLRSGGVSIAEQPSNSRLPGNVPESPGRMSLRRSNASVAEKTDSSATPPKVKKFSQKFQTTPKSPVTSSVLEEEQNPNVSSAKLTVKTEKPLKDQKFKDSPSSSLPESTLISVNLPTSGPVLHSPSKFLEVLNENENQHLITDLNVKFDKMQKGWVQMDKEAQPPPKPKNKGDRLKEIWKSKKRIRKPRSLEQQRFSPVQTLFMKSFDLPSICRWFLQSTETKSLVIVKKVNTRLPSETQLCFHSSASLPGSTNGVFPSLQAERLKKHLKKFAIASPVKSTPKTKRLIAKALAEGLSVSKGKEKREPNTATRISTKPHSYSGLIQTSPSESHSKVTANTKNPASARILRKYSNIREKMQVQQKKTLKTLKSKETSKPRVMPKNISKKEMSTSKGRKSAIVKKVKVLAKKATTKSSSVKAQTPKSVVSKALKGLKSRAGLPTKKVLPKKSKTNPVTNTKTKSKKEMVAKTDLQKSPHTKTEHHKKSPAPKGSESLTSQSSQATDTKPSNSEDQVLTRSQRKVDAAALAQTRSPKAATKRGMEASPSSAKRTRTSK